MDYSYIDNPTPNRGFLIEVHIADLHFGAFDPKLQYEILCEQFLNPISVLPRVDIISIDGDIFDHKVMSNSDIAMYSSMFIDNLVRLTRDKNATLLILHGTHSHDYDQLKLFYHYTTMTDVDVRIVTTLKFEMIKGAKILCIPELYRLDESYYRHFFFESGYYDAAFVHGTFKGSVYGDNVGSGRLLTADDFIYCKGVVISGHVHKSGCFEGFYYYCGCPYRWRFGEEEEKGFLIVLHDLDTQMHHVSFEPIHSFRYDTISIDSLISEDPKKIIDYIDNLKASQGIDFIKIKFKTDVPGHNRTIINNYYRNIKDTFIEFEDIKTLNEERAMELKELEVEYNYLMDKKISDIERFVEFVNSKEGEGFITVDRLKSILEDPI